MRRPTIKRILCLMATSFCLAFFSYSCRDGGDGGDSGFRIANSVETIIDDMSLPHEALPHGVPSDWSWAQGPEVAWGDQPPPNCTAMTAWGQVYESIEGNPAANTRVHLKNISAYYLSRNDGQWHLLQHSVEVQGLSYREDYAGDISIAPDIRFEPEGSVSIRAGGGYNFHFWPPDRVTIDPEDIAAIFATVQARLVLDDPYKPDDRAQARYILNMGGDYWLDTSVAWDNWETNFGIAVGRFKFVAEEWLNFNMITLSASDVRSNPPPIQ